MAVSITFLEIMGWSIYLVWPLLLALFIMIIGLGLFVASMEKWRKFDGIYWAFVTATTVGYGDIRPLAKFPRVLSIIIAILGMMLTGIFIAITVNAVTLSVHKHFDHTMIEHIKSEIK